MRNFTNKPLSEKHFSKSSKIEKSYDSVKKTSDSRFGNYTVIQNRKTGHLAMATEKATNNLQEATSLIHQAKRRLEMKHPNIQTMYDYSTHKKRDFCSMFYKVRGFYELPVNDLSKEIAFRKKNLQEFDHEELTHIAYQGLSGLEYLQSQKSAFIDLRPSHISFDSENCSYKLLDRLNNSSPIVESQVNNILAGRPLYTSPCVFEAIQSGEKLSNHDQSKTDCFALGMCLLEAGTLDSVQNVYNFEKGRINDSNLDRHIANFRGKYEEDNSLLCDLTESLLTEK